MKTFGRKNNITGDEREREKRIEEDIQFSSLKKGLRDDDYIQ